MMDNQIDAVVEHQQKRNIINDQVSSRDHVFACLEADVQSCRLCVRMEGRTRVLGPSNGSPGASVLFVAEAPGRLGADRWNVPLFGDQSGKTFEVLLQAAGLDRSQIFITNAVLCNPRNEQGNNASPARIEIENCSRYLHRTITLIQPRYVVALGQVALKALQHIAPHDLSLARDVGVPYNWYGRWLIALYHPSPRARVHRPLMLQLDDYRHLGELLQNNDPAQNTGFAHTWNQNLE